MLLGLVKATAVSEKRNAPLVTIRCRDNLFMPSLLEAAGKGQLRVFGNGKNKVSFTYLDNYCHGLILGYDALYQVRATSVIKNLEGCYLVELVSSGTLIVACS